MVRGTLHNGTNGKPQSGDPISLMAGAREIGRVISGEDGSFRMEPKPPATPSADTLKVRVLHDGVSYQLPVKFGVAADVTVYDGTARVEGLSEYLAIFQFEARTADRLLVTELHAIQNRSWPPRTSTGREGFNLSLPKGAHNLLVTITEADGQGARLSIADPANQHGPLRLGVPLKPGLTKYAFTYELPYSGELRFRQSARYFTEKSFIVLPMSMHFTPSASLRFHTVPDKTGAQVLEIDSLAKHDVLGFSISGTGALAQAFRPIGSADESARLTVPTQPAAVDALGSNASPASPASASKAPNQKTSPPAAHAVPANQSVKNWAALVFVLCVLGTLIAWKMSHTKVRHKSA